MCSVQEFKVITTSTEPQILIFIFQKQEEKCQPKYFVPSSMWVSVNLKTIALKSMLRVTVKIFTAKTVNAQNATERRYEIKCSHFRRKICEFKHNSENTLSLEKHLQKVQVEADECGKLRAENKYLQETIKIQKVKLANL